MPALLADPPPIVITASRAPIDVSDSAASVTIIDERALEHLDPPTFATLIRLTPSAAVSTSGPAGSQTDIRIRGAEANHTLIFLDGIRINDPASGDIPRFEVLNSDIASRIEVIRGPQSAQWGSDAIGGVIAVNGVGIEPGHALKLEAGSFGSRRAALTGATSWSNGDAAGALAVQRADGIDSFGSPGGDRDGYRNFAGRLRLTMRPTKTTELGFAGVALTGASQFDGYNLVTYVHEDTLDSSRSRLGAGRVWAAIGTDQSPWRAKVSATYLASSNRNLLDGDPLNRTWANRRSIDAQVERTVVTGSVAHRLILAGEAEGERFHARDTLYDGFTNQDRDRARRALTAEWRADAKAFDVGLAVRRDSFNRFKDATTVRASAVVPVSESIAVAATFAEGIAAPTFFDLYGFFPGNFVGNPALKPERSRGGEVALRYAASRLAARLTVHRQVLRDEIVDVTDFDTFLQSSENRSGLSRRFGIEVEAAWEVRSGIRLGGNYAYLDATQPDLLGQKIVELRRPRHSGALTVDGDRGPWSYGASIAYVGAHRDVRDSFPYDTVRLAPYRLVDARIAYRVRSGIELFARASNLFDDTYQGVAGYRTEGRGLFAGIRLAGRRSSQ